MPNLNENRVLCRRGARELSPEEAELVSAAGGEIVTSVCTALTVKTATHTCPDGDRPPHG